MPEVIIKFPWPPKQLNPNFKRSNHWRKYQPQTKEYRKSCWGLTLEVTGASPADAATNQAITVDISWSAATGADDYDVYFGTDSTPESGELQGNQAGLSYEQGNVEHF